jgi:catechol 2,3-dioxygenase-like lactoylglutathione lyase family enzyme
MIGLNLLVLRCRDVERARAFYESLGQAFERHRHGDGPEHWASESATGVFELYPATPGAAGDATGLGFAVADLAATATLLTDRGFAPGAPVDRPWGRTFVVRDPDGRRVEVKQA